MIIKKISGVISIQAMKIFLTLIRITIFMSFISINITSHAASLSSSHVPRTQTITLSFVNNDRMPAEVSINTGLYKETLTLNRSGGKTTVTVPVDASITLRGKGTGEYAAIAKDLAPCTQIRSIPHPVEKGVLILSVSPCVVKNSVTTPRK